MATKTLTIAEDAYNLLADRKLEGESFSQEIRRILSEKKKRPLADFFGILSDIDGEAMKKDLERQREVDIRLEKSRRIF